MKKNTKRLLAIVLCLCSLLSILPFTASAASYPLVYLDFESSNQVCTEGTILSFKFTIFREYNNEILHISIYNSNGTKVAYLDQSIYGNSSTVDFTLTVPTDGYSGKYTLKYYMSFYTYFEWHDAPNVYSTTFTVTKPCANNAHKWDNGTVTTAATCTATGIKTYKCTACGAQKTESVPKGNHSWDQGTITTAATCTNPGTKTYKCTTCGTQKTETTPKGNHNMVNGYCTYCGSEVAFNDVGVNDYFYAPVVYAVKNNITNGTGTYTFSPNDPCTRGQIVTFLWRAFGSPEPTSYTNPFTDVPSSQYYYKAVLWAVENGITSDMSATTFAPDATCTRAQAATFLWRASASPSISGTNNPFTDVANGTYYYVPVLWAVENGITNGTAANKFSPDDFCTRGQIVTFLYRALAK